MDLLILLIVNRWHSSPSKLSQTVQNLFPSSHKMACKQAVHNHKKKGEECKDERSCNSTSHFVHSNQSALWTCMCRFHEEYRTTWVSKLCLLRKHSTNSKVSGSFTENIIKNSSSSAHSKCTLQIQKFSDYSLYFSLWYPVVFTQSSLYNSMHFISWTKYLERTLVRLISYLSVAYKMHAIYCNESTSSFQNS